MFEKFAFKIWKFRHKTNYGTSLIEDLLNCYPAVSLPITSTAGQIFHKEHATCRNEIFLDTAKDTLAKDIESLSFLGYEDVKPHYNASNQSLVFNSSLKGNS